jgi:hypothetical protein
MKFRVFIVCSLIMMFVEPDLRSIRREQSSSDKMLGAKRYVQLIRQKPTKEQKARLLPDSRRFDRNLRDFSNSRIPAFSVFCRI